VKLRIPGLLFCLLQVAYADIPCDPSKKDFYNQHCTPAGQTFKDLHPCDPTKKDFYNQHCIESKPKDQETTHRNAPNNILNPMKKNRTIPSFKESTPQTEAQTDPESPTSEDSTQSADGGWEWMQS